MVNQTRKNIYFKIAWIGLTVVLVVLGFFYFSGYRVDREGGVKSPGAIQITSPIDGATVYIGRKEETLSKKQGQKIYVSPLPSGIHSVLLSKDNYWPWKKDVEVSPGSIIVLNPFLISKNVSGSLITGEDPEYEKISQMVESEALPALNQKRTSNDGSVSVWVEDNTIFAEWRGQDEFRPDYFCTDPNNTACPPKITVFSSKEKIRSLDFYKDYQDVLMVSMRDSIAALDLNPSGTQNFQPIYTGLAPSFVKTPQGGSIFVSDGTSLLEVSI